MGDEWRVYQEHRAWDGEIQWMTVGSLLHFILMIPELFKKFAVGRKFKISDSNKGFDSIYEVVKISGDVVHFKDIKTKESYSLPIADFKKLVNPRGL